MARRSTANNARGEAAEKPTQPDPAIASASPGPLTGIRILDMTTVLLGPYAAQMLGDQGADVIKIEAPGGDSTRQTGPARERGMASAFLGANRNKRSVVLDLKQASAQDAFLQMIEDADVLLCSIRPQKLADLGIDIERLRVRNPRLIVVTIQGFGEDGPYAGRPAYDDIIQGLCGLAALSGGADGEPRYLPTVIADKTCALFATQAVLMALVGRATTGSGSHVDVPMLECMVSFTLVEHLYGGQFNPPLGDLGYSRLLTKWRKPYPTLDGYVCVVPYSDQHWRRFFNEAGRADLLSDPRFADMAARTQNIDALYAELAACIATRTSAEWLETCDRLDVPAAPLRSLQDLQSDPHLKTTGFFERIEDPNMGSLTMPASPLRVMDVGACPIRVPPRLGEHTREVLAEAGVSDATVEDLLDSGAAVQA